MTENGEKSPFFIYFEYIKNTIRILYSATTTHIVFYLFVFLPILKIRSKIRLAKIAILRRRNAAV